MTNDRYIYESTSSLPSSHQRTEAYTNKIPSQPRLLIPTPLSHIQTLFELGPPRPHTLSHQLQPLPLGGEDEWTFNKRRTFSPILPYLHIGPAYGITADFLKQGAWTMVIGIATRGLTQTRRAISLADKAGLPTLFLHVESIYSLTAVYPQVTRAINAHIEQLGWAVVPPQSGTTADQDILAPRANILLTCETGQNYSASACAAYLMETFSNIYLEQAMQICLTNRFSCHFALSGVVLQAYEQIVRATSNVLMHHEPETRTRKTIDVNSWFRRKRDRFLHNVDDEAWADTQRFEGRSGPQPFI